MGKDDRALLYLSANNRKKYPAARLLEQGAVRYGDPSE